MIPAILAVLLLSKVERRLKPWIPEVAALVFVPCLALLAGIGQLFVVFGVYWGIIPLALINIQV